MGFKIGLNIKWLQTCLHYLKNEEVLLMFADLFYNLGGLVLDLCSSVTARVIIQVLVKQWWMADCCPQQCIGFYILHWVIADASKILKSGKNLPRGLSLSDCHCLDWRHFGQFCIIQSILKMNDSAVVFHYQLCDNDQNPDIWEKCSCSSFLLSMFFTAIYRRHKGVFKSELTANAFPYLLSNIL